ncbi:MAG: undecaprenyl-diphosphate phosphatase [Micromonosporaceae bacterium]|nr:undecaprenyl-diphosphate phosphatase [Micromonosporaceae bacterium]
MSAHLSYAEALVVGAMQGVAELFPVSSLGHSVLLPALVGGSWARDLNVSTPESPYLAYVVGLHVATALALVIFFWREWVRILGGLFTSIRDRRVESPDQRLAWMIVIGTIPVGISGLLLEHLFRTVLGRPVPAATFLMINGLVLYGAERLIRRSRQTPVAARPAGAGVYRSTAAATDARHVSQPDVDDPAAGGDGTDPDLANIRSNQRIASRSLLTTTLIASAQILALLPGISRSGITMAAGLTRGLSHEDAARFSFLLATPVILAAGVLKVPDLFGHLGTGIHGQVLAGSIASGVGAYLSVRFLTRWFTTRTLIPFAVYCLLAGAISIIVLAVR